MSQTDTHSAHHDHDREMIPRVLIRAVCSLLCAILLIVTYASVTDRPLSATPPVGDVVKTRDMVLSGDMSGAVQVHAPDGTLIADLTPEQGGFISGVYRVIERERMKHGLTENAPITLNWMSTGRLSITDPATGWSADLMGFGATNAKAFARLLAQ